MAKLVTIIKIEAAIIKIEGRYKMGRLVTIVKIEDEAVTMVQR